MTAAKELLALLLHVDTTQPGQGGPRPSRVAPARLSMHSALFGNRYAFSLYMSVLSAGVETHEPTGQCIPWERSERL